jgi:hypothetical protein
MGRTARLDTISGSKQLLLISLAYGAAVAPRGGRTSLISHPRAVAPRGGRTSLISHPRAVAPRGGRTSLISHPRAVAPRGSGNDSHSPHHGQHPRTGIILSAQGRERESFSATGAGTGIILRPALADIPLLRMRVIITPLSLARGV